MTTPTVHCANCGAVIDEPAGTQPENRQPCPACGSIGRNFQVALEGHIEFHDSVRLKLKDAATGKTKVDQFSGDDLRQKTGNWMKKVRLIDHERDQYKEVVTDPESGQEIHRCEEPITNSPKVIATIHDSIKLARMVLRSLNGC